MPTIDAATEYSLTASAVGRRMGVTRTTVWIWIKNWLKDRPTVWKLPAMKSGRAYRVSEDDLSDLIRRTNPKLWKELAEEDQAERRGAKREAKKLRERLGD